MCWAQERAYESRLPDQTSPGTSAELRAALILLKNDDSAEPEKLPRGTVIVEVGLVVMVVAVGGAVVVVTATVVVVGAGAVVVAVVTAVAGAATSTTPADVERVASTIDRTTTEKPMRTGL